MKIPVSSLVFSALLATAIVGCGGSEEPRTATDGATPDAIAEYEAAVAAMEQQNLESGMEAEADAGQ